jgi:hypothetical protein
MKFTLIYDGDLPASGNAPKPRAAADIRDIFHPQLAELWRTNLALKKLRYDARVYKRPAHYGWSEDPHANFDAEPPPLPPDMIDLTAPIEEGGRKFIPLVRKSLGLACGINLLFLRKEQNGGLILQSGDLDNRLKTLFDALRKPSVDEADANPPSVDPLYCLLESDSLVMDFAVKTDRLLSPISNRKHEVRLIVEVTVKILHLNLINLSLGGE